MIEAVAGFLFSHDLQHVSLIRKNKPTFHAGMLNAIGGKIEPGESPYEAMLREFTEETGITVGNWQQFLVLQVPNWKVYFFRAKSDLIHQVKSVTDEQVGVYFTQRVINRVHHTVPNIPWMLPMALCSNVISADVIEGSNV